MKKSLALPVAVSVAVALIYVAGTLQLAKGVPMYVATHFDLTGRPNGWETRQGFITFSLAIGLGIQMFVPLVSLFTRFVPARFVNMPHKKYWHLPENFPAACNHMLRFSLWLGCMLLLWMGLINYQIVEANKLMPPKLDTAAFLVAMGTFMVMLAVWFACLWRAFRVPAQIGKKSRR